jgi:hypothetical protein
MKEADFSRNSNDSHSDISQQIARTLAELRQKFKLSERQILQFIKSKETHVPASIFSNNELSGLELVCKYLKDDLDIPFSKIAKLLNRDYRTIWTTYKAAGRKLKGSLTVPHSKYFFPISILANRELSVLEAIVAFMKEQLGLKYSVIAAELHRDQRNMWTVYKRANEKRK